MSVRQEIEVLPADPITHWQDRIIRTPRNTIRDKNKLGFTVRETIGVAVVNPRGVARGKKSVIVGDGND